MASTNVADLPRSARLAAWATSWLAGGLDLSDVVDRTRGADEPHTVVDLPDLPGEVQLGTALESLRTAGATSFAVALPAAGDPAGLAGPPGTNAEAIDAGEAVLVLGVDRALIPDVTTFGPPGDQGHLVTWRTLPAAPPRAETTLADADQELTLALRDAADVLAGLDVAGWRPEAAALLDEIRTPRPAAPLPHGFPSRAQSVAATATRLAAVVRFALDDDGGAVHASGASARAAALRPLERAARHALQTAANAGGADAAGLPGPADDPRPGRPGR